MPEPALVLVVDDNDDLRDSVAEVLESQGFAVATAPTADAALALADRGARAPDAILLDLIMPGMSAARFVSLVRDRSVWARAKVILFTAVDAEDARGFPADATMAKPCRMEHLLAALAAVGVSPPAWSDKHR